MLNATSFRGVTAVLPVTMNSSELANALSEYEPNLEAVMCIQANAIRFGKPVNNGARFVYNSSF